MRKINSFQFMTLNGFLQGPNGDISWHKHRKDEETNQFAEEGAQSQSILLFGRVTYEMMAGYWPSPMAKQNDPKIADGMNKSEKIVFSNSMKNAEWENTKVVRGDIIQKMKEMKKAPGNNMTLLGSGSILSQFAENGLIDSFQIMLDPLAIGSGVSIFSQISKQLNFKLIDVKKFNSGVLLLNYEPS